MKYVFDKSNRGRVVGIIFRSPDRSFHLRELADEAGISPSTASRIVKELEEERLIEVERGLKLEITAADTGRFRSLKQGFNLWELAESGLIDELEDDTVPEAIVLFGSYARGEDDSDSDIDLAVVNGREPGRDFSRYEEELDRRVNVHNVDLDEADQNFVETLANGTVLRGYLEI